jgi:streptomycin 6-kinase
MQDSPVLWYLQDMFERFLNDWKLTPDGIPIVTPRSRLLPVRRADELAMLRIALEAEEKCGILLMEWWDGQGAAKVLARKTDAVSLERAEDRVSLAELSRNGRDDEATRIICTTVKKLHAPRPRPLPTLIPAKVRDR